MLAKPNKVLWDEETFGGGSIGEITMRNTQNGISISQKSNPRNPQTQDQVGVRSKFTQAAQGWAGLTDNQRQGWGALATMHGLTNEHGDTYHLTGFQQFVAVNALRLQTGQAMSTDAPDAMPEVDVINAATIVLGDVQTFTVHVTDPASYPEYVAVYATGALHSGRVAQPSDYRLIHVLSPTQAAAGTTDMYNAYVAKFGARAIGDKVAVRLTPIDPLGFKAVASFTTPVTVIAQGG